MTDAFLNAVNDARHRLEEREGRRVGVNELARRASYPRSNMHFHLNPNRAPESRRVPAELVKALAKVLPISEADLARPLRSRPASRFGRAARVCRTCAVRFSAT